MDIKVTLSFDQEIVERAKRFADAQNISLSRLTEMLYKKMTSGNYKNIEDFPIADWVKEVAEGAVEYKTNARSRRAMKKEYFKSRK